MFNNGCYAKLTDLGLARTYEHSKASVTQQVGTMDYWAPELWKKKPVQYKSDMYSLGIILYFMMTKRRPKYDDEIKTGLFMIPDEYSKELYDICGKLLKKKPE